MEPIKVTAADAQTEIASIMNRAAFHKRQVRWHRRELSNCMIEAENIRREYAESLGIEVQIVPQAHSQEAESNGHQSST